LKMSQNGGRLNKLVHKYRYIYAVFMKSDFIAKNDSELL